MIDLILHGTKAAIQALAFARGLVDASGKPVPNVDYCWWAETGKFMTAAPIYDTQGNVTTGATYLPNFVCILRIWTKEDAIQNPVDSEQWSRSQIAKWIKNNGIPGTIGGLPCYIINNVRLLRAIDVQGWLTLKGLPGHEWAGGNIL